MAIVYVDSSEVREGSLLPDAIAQIAIPVVGLESYTGADIAISMHEFPYDNALHPPGSVVIKAWAKKAVLIQRKTGADLLNSIPDLGNIIIRMATASDNAPWLTPIGNYVKMSDGNVGISGDFRQFATNWRWNAYMGALDAWQLKGGIVHPCIDDAEFIRFIGTWDDKKLTALEKGTFASERKSATYHIDPNPERFALQGFPHIGDKMSADIFKFCGYNLACALSYLSAIDPGGEAPGVGPKTRRDIRKFLGLEDDQQLIVATKRGEEIELCQILQQE